MRLRRSAGLLAAAVLFAVPLAAVGGATPLLDLGVADSTPTPAVRPSTSAAPTPSGARVSATPAPEPTRHDVLALGDSVPAGNRCGCRPFPQRYGAMLSTRTGVPVSVDNRAVGGLDTAGLLAQLRTSSMQAAVRRADIVVITIGANDFSDHHDAVVDGACEAGGSDCVSDEMGTMRAHLATALTRIHALRQGRPTTVLVTGYWNVFQDGDVARHAFGTAGLQASRRLTVRANAAIRSVATAAGARYVDLYQPFQRYGRQITSYLAWDGDHPDAAGHQLIAEALLAAGLPGTS